MNFEEIQCKLERLQAELEKAKIENERAYYKLILNELVDIRLLLDHILKKKSEEPWVN